MRCMITISDHDNFFSYGLYHLFKSRLKVCLLVKTTSLGNESDDGFITISLCENVSVTLEIRDKKHMAKELSSEVVIFRNDSVNQLIRKVEYTIANMLKHGHGHDVICNDRGVIKLTSTQIKICEFFYNGITTKTASLLLNLSEKTISTHKRNVMRKINVINNQGLYLWIEKNKIHYF
ncbi:helix-turn-helix transcriptional regulator [Yersinia massiliensis]|uniref:helix-turn-helix transcriptional regulator n=1 Tax=Yersinia massiliensis TaxID=419257 RepID=UPI0005B64A56|nr:LuxR C-terminal-related transcriptional regulator [Yersinia massiliensis]